jgi:hypothetical protein
MRSCAKFEIVELKAGSDGASDESISIALFHQRGHPGRTAYDNLETLPLVVPGAEQCSGVGSVGMENMERQSGSIIEVPDFIRLESVKS